MCILCEKDILGGLLYLGQGRVGGMTWHCLVIIVILACE